ncbi:MAG: formylglycine-generating enzyme family protein [Bacteroidia bacterium]
MRDFPYLPIMSVSQPATLSIHTETLPGGQSFNMVKVEGGRFLLDDKIETQISTFYMGQYPVTQVLWEAVMGENPSSFKGRYLPVEYVSWIDCHSFLKKLNRHLGLSGNSAYRLPTEAEWEYAAGGGIYRSGNEYAGSSRLESVGWYRENSHRETQPGGLLAPNELGIFDMSGNIWEWCADWYGKYTTPPLNDPKGPENGRVRVLRGGSWSSNESDCRVAFRDFYLPDSRSSIIGFRLSRTGL